MLRRGEREPGASLQEHLDGAVEMLARPAAETVDGEAGDFGATGGGRLEAGKDPAESGFTGAALADETGDGGGREGEVDVDEGLDVAGEGDLDGV